EKALGNGYPISAIITTSDFEDKCSSSELYYAQSHQLDPLGAAVAKKVVKVFEEDAIIERSQSTIFELNKFFKSLNYGFIEEVRSIGMIFALNLKDYKNIRTEKLVVKLKNELLNVGVLVGYNVGQGLLRLLPPLTMETEEIQFLKEKMINVFGKI
ncbi:unnamed protein product, partial [marine sediment metagenome]